MGIALLFLLTYEALQNKAARETVIAKQRTTRKNNKSIAKPRKSVQYVYLSTRTHPSSLKHLTVLSS
jgi:hypothetical protein